MPYYQGLLNELSEIKETAIRQIKLHLSGRKLVFTESEPIMDAKDSEGQTVKWVSEKGIETEDTIYPLEYADINDLIWLLGLLESRQYKDYGGKIE